MPKSPAYQWYPKDIIGSERVAFLSLIEEGAYRRALDFCWLHGSIPSDPKKLALLIGKKCTSKIASAIIHMFIPHESDSDRLIHDRQELEREKQSLFSTKQSENGKMGGRPKLNPTLTQNKPNPLHIEKPKKALHLQSSSSEEIYKERWITNPVKHFELTAEETHQTKEFIHRLTHNDILLSANRIKDFWIAFQTLSFDGEKIYESRAKCIGHFRNWLKKQELTVPEIAQKTETGFAGNLKNFNGL